MKNEEKVVFELGRIAGQLESVVSLLGELRNEVAGLRKAMSPKVPALQRLNIEIPEGSYVRARDGMLYQDAILLLGDAGFCRFAPKLPEGGNAKPGYATEDGTVLAFLFMQGEEEHPPSSPPMDRAGRVFCDAFESSFDLDTVKCIAAGLVAVPGTADSGAEETAPCWVFTFKIRGRIPVPELHSGTCRYLGRALGPAWDMAPRPHEKLDTGIHSGYLGDKRHEAEGGAS